MADTYVIHQWRAVGTHGSRFSGSPQCSSIVALESPARPLVLGFSDAYDRRRC